MSIPKMSYGKLSALFITLMHISLLAQMSKDDIADAILENTTIPDFSYDVSIKTVAVIGTASVTDSGTASYSVGTNSVRIEMASGTVKDTTMNLVGSDPFISAIMQTRDFSVVSQTSEKVVLSYTVPVEGQNQQFTAEYRLPYWHLVKTETVHPIFGSVSTTVSYTEFNGIPFLSETDVNAPGAFRITTSYSDYTLK